MGVFDPAKYQSQAVRVEADLEEDPELAEAMKLSLEQFSLEEQKFNQNEETKVNSSGED